MKLKKLTNEQLDYWVAKAINREPVVGREVAYYSPSTQWVDAGKLIEEYEMTLRSEFKGFNEPIEWRAAVSTPPAQNTGSAYADTPHRAICMAVIESVYGDEVEDTLEERPK